MFERGNNLVEKHRQRVIDARDAERTIKAELKARTDKFEDSVEELRNRLAKAGAVREDLEATLRMAAVAHFVNTGENEPTPGVKIKIMTRVHYKDQAAVLWAIQEGFDAMLTLKRTPFEQWAKARHKAGKPLEFVSVSQEPTATLSRHLPLPSQE